MLVELSAVMGVYRPPNEFVSFSSNGIVVVTIEGIGLCREGIKFSFIGDSASNCD